MSVRDPQRAAAVSKADEVIVVGAGAAGLATAIFLKQANRGCTVKLLDGARMPGAKILVSGGSRCNVTNRVVSELDFWGGRRTIIRRILRSFSVDDTVEFFRAHGVTLVEETDGKLFPESGRARDVLNALLRAAATVGVDLLVDHRVLDIQPVAGGFDVRTRHGTLRSHMVVLATGGESLPKSGSDGAGLRFAARLGHSIVATTPALSPLVVDHAGEAASFRRLAGVTHEAELSIWIDGSRAWRLRGSLLWTHFGLSGPVALNASRHWLRATLEGHRVRLTASFCPGATFETQEALLIALGRTRPKASVLSILSALVPASVASVLLEGARVPPERQLGHLPREQRRRIARALVETAIPVTGCRGYNVAEATAGGVALDEIDPRTMASRRCPGLYLVGEMLDVDGRIGGFNFQWAWSTAFLAGQAIGSASR
jgi:predicted Rossmann fold flavoprotein